MLDAYMGQIKEGFKALNDYEKKRLLQELDKTAQILENGCFAAKKTPKYLGRRNMAFDPKKARRIREKENLTQIELVEELELDLVYGSRAISSYETGVIKPSCPTRGVVAPKYLKWLKKHGYNPFNL